MGGYIAGLAPALALAREEREFLLFSTPERNPVSDGVYGQMPTAVLPWPRRLTQAAWCLVGQPRVNGLHGRFDLLHILVPSVPVPTDLPLVVTIHDLMPMKFPGFFSWKNRLLFRLTMRQVQRQADRVVAISECTRRDVVELLNVPKERVSIVHYGPPRSFRPQPPDRVADILRRRGLADSPFILFVGEITHRKNPIWLVEAFGKVAGRLPDHVLVIAGPPGLGYEKVTARIAELGLRNRVLLPGHVAHDELPALMAGARVFVLPSAYEGFGMPVLEAMMCGTPVVVSDAGSLPEVVGEAGFVVPQAEPSALASAILKIAQDPSTRDRLVRKGYERLGAFSWERAARQTVAVYEDALREGRR